MEQLRYGQPMQGSAHDLFPKNWLNPKLMQQKYGSEIDLTIDYVSPHKTYLKRTNSDTDVFVVWFQEIQEGLILNATNNDTLITLHGDIMRYWTGKPICLYIEPLVWNPNEGKKAPAIRLRQSMQPPENVPANGMITSAQLQEISERGRAVYNGEWGKRFPQQWVNYFTDNKPDATMESLTEAQADRLLEGLRTMDADDVADSRTPEEGEPEPEPAPEAPPTEYYPAQQTETPNV